MIMINYDEVVTINKHVIKKGFIFQIFEQNMNAYLKSD